MKDKNILITGGLGFIGSNLARYLIKKNKNVTILDNSFRGNVSNVSDIKNELRIIKCNLLSEKNFEKKIKKIDTIIHCAAINGTKNFYNNPSLVLDVGVVGLINLVESCKNKNID